MEQANNSVDSIRAWLNSPFPTRNSIARDTGICLMQAYKIGHGMSQPKDETIEKFRSAAVRRRDELLKELFVVQSIIEK